MRGNRSNGVTIAACLLVALVSKHASGQWVFVNLHPAGADASEAWGGADGQQVGGALIGGQWHASVWSGSAASWIDLHPGGSAVYSFAYAARNGQQVGFTNFGSVGGEGGVQHASVWSGVPSSWISLHPTGSESSYAYGIHSGRQAGHAYIGGLRHASVWSGTIASRVDLHPSAASESQARGIHNGQQTGFAIIDDLEHASVWSGTAASWVDLNPIGASRSYAWDVYAGVQVGFADFGGQRHAGLWSGTPGSWVDLHPESLATTSEARSVYHGRQVGFARVEGRDRASFWRGTPDSWEDLSLVLVGSWGDTRAESVWVESGTTHVAGFGDNLITGRREAILWLLPCPSEYNGSGGAGDVLDFLDFVDDFGSCVGQASPCGTAGNPDVNGDTVIDVLDFLDFLDSFGLGCN